MWFERLRRLVDYVGDARLLTDRGNLKLADGKALVDLLETGDRFDEQIGDRVFKTRSSADLDGVDLAFRMAVESKMLTRKGKKLLPGPNAPWVDDPLAALYGAWLVLLTTIGPTQHWYRHHRYNWDWYAEDLDASLPMILIDVYRHGDTPIEEIAEDTWAHLHTVFDLDDVPADKLAFHRNLVEGSLRRAFDVLGELGTVRVEDVAAVPTDYGGTVRTGGVVGLTPLGKWVVQRLASRVTSAPIVGALRESTAAELLAAASDISETKATAEIDAWVDHHRKRFVRLLGAVIELWGPAAALSAWAGPAAGADGLLSMVDQAWRVRLRETEQVLAAIGSGHPDKPIAKAARKALFKYRTAG